MSTSASMCKEEMARQKYAYLCGKRIAMQSATPHAIARVRGVSPAKARQIFLYWHAHRDARMSDLENIRGIGPKTVARLRDHFY